MPYQHLTLSRDEPVTDRHRIRRNIPRFRPPDPRQFGADLAAKWTEAKTRIAQADRGGFDQRRLLKIILRQREALPQFDAIQGIEIVSQEDKAVVLAFASQQGLDEFEARLATLAQSGEVARKEIFYAIEDFDRWTPEDRKGAALIESGFPDRPLFMLDVELWPLELNDVRARMLNAFIAWLEQQGVQILDRLAQPSLVMVRIRTTGQQADAVLNHRDVRTVDLPPRLGVSLETLITDINRFPPLVAPAADAPRIAVLDTGLTTNHPLIGAAVGDAQGFVAPDRRPDDNVPLGHGTFVSGLALYGDVEACIREGQFVPLLRLFSARVFNDDDNDQTEFVETAIEAAVRELHNQYQCRIFNLSYGDLNKIYDGRRVRGLAYTLDHLTRELGVLFIVPTGNLLNDQLPADPRAAYPGYLLKDRARLLDPATALNAITVGGLAYKTATVDTQRHPDSIEDTLIAAEWQPAPFTRSGPSVGGAIKPDFVEEAGNYAVMRAAGRVRYRGLGLVSFNSGFAAGNSFREDVGTSFAAPILAHKAAKLAGKFPAGSSNLLRAVLAVHARWPAATRQLLDANDTAEGRKKVLQLVGYGKVDDGALYESLDQIVTLYGEESIGNNKHHFFELPVPDEFWTRGRRTREVSVALAHSPEVRTTRLDYKRTKVWFSLVAAASLDDATRAFTHGRADGLPERSTGRLISGDDRKPGTLQMARWKFREPLGNERKLFVVVARQDANWTTAPEELEPYAIAVVLNDAENATVNLYERVNALLQARLQDRERARARI